MLRILQEKLFEKRSAWKAFTPALICAAIIFCLSVISTGIQLPETFFSPDKIGHFAAYGLLSWLMLNGLRKTGRQETLFSMLAIAAVSGYGISLEFVQWAFFPHRYFEVWDMIANIAGAVFSYLAMKGLEGLDWFKRFSDKPPKPI